MAERTEANEPAWGGEALRVLREAGLIPAGVKRVIIDIPHDSWVEFHIVHTPLDGVKFVETLPAIVRGAAVKEVGADAGEGSD